MPRWTFSREIVPFHICELMKPESVCVTVHSLLSISTFVHILENRLWVCMQMEALIRLHKCLSLQLAYVDSYNVHLLLQWPRQFELLKRRSVKARGACKSCRFYVSLNLLHVYLLFFSFSVYFTKIEWLFKKDRYCSERRQIITIVIIIIPWTVCSHNSNKQTDNVNLIIHLEFMHTKTYLMPYVNIEGPNQNVNCHYLWWWGICSSSGAFCQMEIMDIQTISSFKILTGQQRCAGWSSFLWYKTKASFVFWPSTPCHLFRLTLIVNPINMCIQLVGCKTWHGFNSWTLLKGLS